MNDRKRKKSSRIQAAKAWFRTPAFKILVSAFLLILIAASGVVLYYYQYDSRMIDRRLSGEVFQNTARLYAEPYRIYPGQKLTPDAAVARLQRAGFEPEGTEGSDGTYQIEKNRITVKPVVGDTLRLDFEKGTLARIVKPSTGEVGEAVLPAEIVTNLSDMNRQKRRVVAFKELPKNLVNALIAAEDNRFFNHYGIDPVRLAGAIFQSVKTSDRVRGTSTLTQQLSRNFFLTLKRSMGRKIHEAFIALLLEQRLTKEQILTLYANDVYLGERGSFSIKGFGEGAYAYFGKDLTALTLQESATLVAMIPAPNGVYSPTKHPDELQKRRNIVLNAMTELKFITAEEAEKAKETELKVAPLRIDSTDAPYLVDYIRESLLKDFSEDELGNDGLRIYTTIRPDLQRAAVDAVAKGLKSVEDTIAQRNKNKKNPDNLPGPQAALIALETRTGAIISMVGGSDYGSTQYNRITQAFRQPGSIFKPLVYTAAFEAAEQGAESGAAATPEITELDPSADGFGEPEHISISESGPITAATVLDDVATKFIYDGDRVYEPNNYHEEYHGPVTVREALKRSLNVPTIKIGERIGFDRVASLAKRAGLNAKIKAYPSIALGAFEVTPLEMAGAYTMFPNEGRRLEPHALLKVIGPDGRITKSYRYNETQVISPQVAYLMTNLMEDVVASGTAAGVRSRGFNLPAAGKTGTSRDGWFAGFTKDFVVIAWVGYDDNRDLNIEGARSALPIWTEFMLKAQQLYPPRDIDAMNFTAPDGMEFVRLDSGTHLPATSNCPSTYEEVFLPGTVPGISCPLHGGPISNILGGVGGFFKSLFGGGSNSPSETEGEPSTSSR